MALEKVPSTPVRRSARHNNQPVVKATLANRPGVTHKWLGAPLYTRTMRSDADHTSTEDSEGDDHSEAIFYDGFTRQKEASPKANRKGKGKQDQEVYRIGDTVLVNTLTSIRYPSVGVIISMWQEGPVIVPSARPELTMKIKIHWFLRPNELAKVRASRSQLKNEIYYSLSSTAVVTPNELRSPCSVTENPPATKNDGDESDSDDESTEFYCHLAVNPTKGLFYPFEWHRRRTVAMKSKTQDEDMWNVRVSEPTPNSKTKLQAEVDDGQESGDSGDEFVHDDSEDNSEDDCEEVIQELEDIQEEGEDEDLELDDMVLRTPSKRRKRVLNIKSTPSRPKKPSKTAPTPHSKAALRLRQKNKGPRHLKPLRPLFSQNVIDLSGLPKDAHLRSMHLLHVGSRPDALPCREDEFVEVLGHIVDLVEGGAGGCVYISGVPGTGKTATVHAVVRELKQMAERNETNPFTYVEINGLKISEPSAAYALLWEAVSGHDIANDGHLKMSSKEALKRLDRHFSAGGMRGPGGHACVVLMDELDQLMTTKQDVIYNFFNWPSLVGSKLIVIAVANTMNLPERVMTGKVRSRLGMTRVDFKPYATAQLEQIVNSRLEQAVEGLDNPQKVLSADAVKLASMRVATVSGDARRALDICRRAVELAYSPPNSRTVGSQDINAVIKEMQNSPTAAYLRECSFHEKVMLAAALKCTRKEGVQEIKFGDVSYQHMILVPILAADTDSTRRPSAAELSLVLDSLLASRALLIEDGGIAARKSEADRKVILNLEEAEISRVLGDQGDRWRSALGT